MLIVAAPLTDALQDWAPKVAASEVSDPGASEPTPTRRAPSIAEAEDHFPKAILPTLAPFPVPHYDPEVLDAPTEPVSRLERRTPATSSVGLPAVTEAPAVDEAVPPTEPTAEGPLTEPAAPTTDAPPSTETPAPTETPEPTETEEPDVIEEIIDVAIEEPGTEP